MDILERLKESVLSSSTIQLNENLDQRAEICSKTIQKWLNRLGYKWKEVQKDAFLDKHEEKDMVEYKKTFLNEIKLLLPYFVEFFNDGSMLSITYFENCIMDSPDQKLIIIMTYHKSTFSINND